MNIINQFMLIGRLACDVEFSKTANNVLIARFRIAVENTFKKDDDGNYETDFIPLICFGNTAEFANRNFSKGDLITVYGSIHNNDFTKADGTKVYSFDFSVESARLLTKKVVATALNDSPKE